MAYKPALDPALADIWDRLEGGARLDRRAAAALYGSRDLAGLGWMAGRAKQRRYGNAASYVINQKLEPTNICVLSCRFCDFARKRGEPGAYEWTIPEMLSRCAEGVREIHVTGGMPPDWRLERYVAIVKALRDAHPGAGIKAYTAVEIAWAARVSRRSIAEVLEALRQAGLAALPGGGAEVFSERVRRTLFPHKISAEEWLDVHRQAHRLGIPSNATLLYGHIETPEERWHHLERIRDLQDETGGFMSFIPLSFQPGTTGLAPAAPPVIDDLKMLAISRLFLDNVPHIKAYWVTLGEETASAALHWGADDIDGTIGGEWIMHAAGARSPAALARDRLEEIIREAGCVPVERDALHRAVKPAAEPRGFGASGATPPPAFSDAPALRRSVSGSIR